MAASSSGESGSDLWSVSGQSKDGNGHQDSTDESNNRRSLTTSRQSSEYYSGESTVKFIWQYSEQVREFDPEAMNEAVDSRRVTRSQAQRSSVLDQIVGNMPTERQENVSKTLKRRSNIQKTLQALDGGISTPKPFLNTASPLLRTAGTPTPLVQRTPMTRLRHSTYTPSGMSSVAESDLGSQDMSQMSEGPALGHSALAASFSVSRSLPVGGYMMGSLSLMDETGVSMCVMPNKPVTSGLEFQDSTIAEGVVDVSALSNLSVLTDKDPIVGASSGLFQMFHQAFVALPNSAQVFDLVSKYEQACCEQVREMNGFLKSSRPGQSRFTKQVHLVDSINFESYTWRLIGSLYSDRLRSSSYEDVAMLTDVVNKNLSEKKIATSLYEREASTRQNQIVIDWLEKNAEDWLKDFLDADKVEYFSESVCWENTLHDLEQQKIQGGQTFGYRRPLVTEMDPDAPVRQNRPLADLDEEDEVKLLRHLFAFIRAGKLEEAQRLCKRCGQYWRAATLEGWRLWHDPNLEDIPNSGSLAPIEGNLCRDVWKSCCWKMSQETKFNMYERAIYAAFTGNLDQLIPACESWEDYLWAYYRVMVDVRVEQEIRLNAGRDRHLENLPSQYWDQNLNPEKIFAELKACPRESIRKQCEEPHHALQTLIILNNVDGMLEKMYEWIQEENQPSNHLLRFMAHLVLFFRATGLETKDDQSIAILKSYIQALIEERQILLIATYTATLPPDLQIATYAYFLENIVERKERQKCLELAEAAGLDVPTITKAVVENIRGKEEFKIDRELSPALEAATSDEDKKKIEAIEWLVFDPSQRAEALKQSNAIMRCFIATRKHAAAREVFNKIPEASIDVIYKQWQMRFFYGQIPSATSMSSRYVAARPVPSRFAAILMYRQGGSSPLPAEDENAIREYLCVKAYLDAYDAFNDWFQHFHHGAPRKPPGENYSNFTEKVAYEQKQKIYEVELERWQKTLDIHTEVTVNRIYKVLLFPEGGWMIDQRVDVENTDSTRSHQLLLLRQLCIPLLCFLIHSVLHSTGQYKQCLQLADVLASEQFMLYEVFRKDELQKMLFMLRNTSLAVLDENMDPIGYDLT